MSVKDAKMSVKDAFVDKMMDAYNRPCWKKTVGKTRIFYESPKLEEIMEQNESVNKNSNENKDDSCKDLITLVTFFEEEALKIKLNKEEDKTKGHTVRNKMKKNTNGKYWNKTKYEEYSAFSDKKHEILENIKSFFSTDESSSSIKKIFQTRIAKGNNAGKSLTTVGVTKAYTNFFNKLWEKYDDLAKKCVEELKIDSPDDENKKVMKCFNKSDVDIINANLTNLWNKYIQLWNNTTAKLEELIGANYDTGLRKDIINRTLYLLFLENKCPSKDKCYLSVDELNDDKTVNKKKNYGSRIMDILKDPSRARIFNLNKHENDVVSNKPDPIIIYDKSGSSEWPDKGLYMKHKDANITYEIEGNDVNVVLNNFWRRHGSEKWDGSEKISLSITLDNKGMVTKSTFSTSGKNAKDLFKDPTEVPLLVSENDHFGFGVAYTDDRKKILNDIDKSNVKTYLGNIKQSFLKDITGRKNEAEKRNKKKSTKKSKKGETAGLFHNETILYAQPVERHYSPMERATYGMDKLELEDITFKF